MAWKRSSVRSRAGPPIFQPRTPCTTDAYRGEFPANTFETYSVTAEIHGNDREKEPFDVSLIIGLFFAITKPLPAFTLVLFPRRRNSNKVCRTKSGGDRRVLGADTACSTIRIDVA